MAVGLVVMGLGTVPAHAQEASGGPKNVIGISPFGLINKFKLKYERVLSPKFTAGGMVAAYYGAYPGIQVTPFARWYVGAEAPNGLYVQGQVGIYRHTSTLTISSNLNSSGTVQDYTEKATISNVGAGAALGYQWISGKRKNISVDINAGFKIYKTGINEGGLTGLTWYTFGPGSFYNGLISMGYAF